MDKKENKIELKKALVQFSLRLGVILLGIIILLLPVFLIMYEKLRGPEF